MEQEILVVNTVHSVQEEHHGSLVIWHKTGRHLWLYDAVVYKQLAVGKQKIR